MPDFNEQDIRQRVMVGYQFVKNLPQSADNANRSHFGSTFPYGPSDEKRIQPDETDLSEKDDELRAATPCIPDEVYDLLHPVLHHCAEMGANPRERDILLLGSLTCLSTSLPGSAHKQQAMRRPRMMGKVLEIMPEKFSYTEFVEKAQTYEVSLRTGQRWLKNLLKKQFIEKQEDKYIKLTNGSR